MKLPKTIKIKYFVLKWSDTFADNVFKTVSWSENVRESDDFLNIDVLSFDTKRVHHVKNGTSASNSEMPPWQIAMCEPIVTYLRILSSEK